MPYGLRDTPAHSQRVMDTEIASAGLHHLAVPLIDEVQQLKDFAAILDMLQACSLRAHPDNFIFGADVISRTHISPHQAQVAAIMALKPPKNVSELRTQLGSVYYYCFYVPMMSQLLADMNRLLKKDKPWVWGSADWNPRLLGTRQAGIMRELG